MKISAIVPVWNGRELLARLLKTLDEQTLPHAELLVIDNGSEDGAPEMAESRGARVIRMGKNAGFAAAVNRGIEEARREWIAILNSDVELAPDYFEKLAAYGDAWFTTGKIYSREGSRIDGTFDVVSRAAMPWRAGHGRSDGALFDATRKIYSAPFTAALFRSDLFRKIGRLEETFESYLEDVDFGLRCAAHGYAGLYIPDARAWHIGSATLGRWHPESVRRMARNQVLLLARHYPREMLFRCWWPIVVGQLLWGGVALRHGAAGAWIRGKCEGVQAFRESKLSNPIESEVLAGILRENEHVISEFQGAAGFDFYWRLYFLLTGSATK